MNEEKAFDLNMEDDINFIIKNQTKEYTKLKLLEEMAELSEVLLKSITKKQEGFIPTEEKLIEGAGDVLAWLIIYARHNGFEEEVVDRAEEKLQKLVKSIKNKNKLKIASLTEDEGAE